MVVNRSVSKVTKCESTLTSHYPHHVLIGDIFVCRYTGGMIIMDALHMPYGCGVWPAWWSNGPNWPNGGEIDILEGVNDFTQNQVSLHTGDGCYMSDSMNQSGTLTTGNFDSHNCASSATSNQGCGVRDMTGSASYGHAFNSVGGGVYASKPHIPLVVYFTTRC